MLSEGERVKFPGTQSTVMRRKALWVV